MPTLKDVADFAGVSTATVSRVLNAPDLVQQATRDRVSQAVAHLGYTPHYGAQVLASNRSNTVGAIIPTMENAIFARGLQAFQEEMAIAGVTMLVASSGYDPQQEAEQIRTLVGRGADGLLLIGIARPEETYHFLRQRNVPYVIAWNFRQDTDNVYAGFDNRQAAMDLTNLVISKGHGQIAMIAGLTLTNDRAADRVVGVRQAALQAGIREGDLTVVESPYTLEDGGKAFQSIWRRATRPSAIICGNDVLAAGAVAKAKEMGLRVPEDISIVGFDDIELATVIEPNLTTVHVPHRRMGQAGAQLLLQLRDDRTDCKSVALDTYIVERGSLATRTA